jgi:hypothetical protein
MKKKVIAAVAASVVVFLAVVVAFLLNSKDSAMEAKVKAMNCQPVPGELGSFPKEVAIMMQLGSETLNTPVHTKAYNCEIKGFPPFTLFVK